MYNIFISFIKILNKKKEEKTYGEVDWVIKKMDQYGSLEHSRNLVKKYADQAEDFFEKELVFLDKQLARDQIKSFITFLKNRQY